jgi:GAF domain
MGVGVEDPIAVPGYELRPSWSALAQRDLTTRLAEADDWHTGLRNVIQTLGASGGWDVVTFWVQDEHRPLLRCLGMWSAGDQLREFEIFTWQSRVPLTATVLGQALGASEPISFPCLAEADDDRLRAAAGHELRTALLVPVRDGRTTIAVIELLTRSPDPLNQELPVAIDAVGRQLAHFRRLLSRVASPLWRFGRF